MERKLAAILSADVVAYARLMGKDEVSTLLRLKALHEQLLGPLIGERKGRVVKLMGDGLLAEFPSVVESLHCAAAIQTALAAQEDDRPEESRIRLRIGVHLGDVIVEGADLYGDGVNISARLEALADPGGICISGAAFDAVEGKLDLTFEDMDLQQVKNIAKPIRVYRVSTGRGAGPGGAAAGPDGGDAPDDRPGGTSAASDAPAVDLNLPPRPVIAVLPFANLSSDPEQAFFADGLAEDIITRLSYLRGLTVISRTSSFVFRGQAEEVRDIARKLGARYVLEGSVRQAGDRFRVVAQLIDGNNAAHVWAQRYDRRNVDIFDLQDEITHAIVTALQVVLTDGELALDPGGTENYMAWELFQQGTMAHLKYTAEDNLRARHLYSQSLLQDPDFIDAKVFRAWTYWQHARSGFAHDRAEEMAACRRELDGLLAEGAATANVKHLESVTLLLERRYPEALAASAEAMALGASKLFGLTPAAIVRIYAGHYEAAVDVLRETIRAVPYTPNDTIYNLAWVLGLLGERARAVSFAEEYMRRVPGDLYAHTTLAVAYGLAGSPDRAKATIDAFRERFPRYRLADFEAHEPFRDPAMLERVLAVLRAAGLPD